MMKQSIKLFEVRLAVHHLTCGNFFATVKVSAKHSATAIRLSIDSAARRYRTHPSQIDCTTLTLVGSTKWTSERVIKYIY